MNADEMAGCGGGKGKISMRKEFQKIFRRACNGWNVLQQMSGSDDTDGTLYA